MDRIWAPWRVKYVTKVVKEKNSTVFSRIYREKKKDKTNFVLIRSKYCYAVLNIYPYNNGHTLIVSNRKVDDLFKLRREEREDMFDLLEEVKSLLDEVLKPQGYNVGINLGRVAGAGFPDHLHIHIVPRWKGDSNFMPVIGGTKVVSQSLKELHKLLTDAYKKRNRKTRR